MAPTALSTPAPNDVNVTWTPYGAPALGELTRLIAEAKESDPLAPVAVVTPSPAVAVATRRALARSGAVVGVNFQSLGALAEGIAAPELAATGIDVGVDRELLVAAVRSALADDPGSLAPIAHHRSTWESIATTIAELDGASDAHLAHVAAAGGIPTEIARLRNLVRSRVGGVGADAIARLATAMVADGRARTDEIGPVIVYLCDRLRPVERDLIASVATRAPVTLIVGTAGNAESDADMAENLAGFHPAAPLMEQPTEATAVVSANDIDDEVRAAVRRLLAVADAGVPLEQLALVHPSGAPYSRVVHDVLASTGVPFSGPSTTTLAQTAVGRLLLRVIDVIATDHGRQAVVDLWSTGIVVDAAGRPLPFAALDERTRRLGIIDRAVAWTESLDADDEWLADRLAELHPEHDERYIDRLRSRLDTNAAVRHNLGRLTTLTADAPGEWGDVAIWAENVIETLCGPRTRRSWPEATVDAEVAIITALGRLTSLERVEPEPSSAVIFDTIATALERPAPRDAAVGAGILVTTLDQPPVVPLEAVAVVGLVEGQAPRVARDDVLLGDKLRVELGLGGRDDRRRRQRRGFDAALATAATHRIVTTARHDQRSGRALIPSRWLVDTIENTTGQRPDVEAMMKGEPVAGVDVVDSYSAGLARLLVVEENSVSPLDDGERSFAALVAAGGIDAAAPADDELRARATLVRARASRAFTRFDGNLDGDGPDITGSVDGASTAVLSPTSLEGYAACPRRWFFGHALGLSTVDRPEQVDRIKPIDRGSLVHRVLELFFEEMIAKGEVPAPGKPWPTSAVERAAEICDVECETYERRGLTGHPRRWEHDREEIHKVVAHTLMTDTKLREAFGVEPVAVEFTFGRDGKPPLVVDLGDGRSLALAGQADRVDVGEGRAVIWDYKYASTRPFEVLGKDEDSGGDRLGFGRKLQLVAYGMAAAEAHDVPEIQARYWFLPRTSNPGTAGYEVTDELRTRFRTALRILADGIGAGRFPARPGEMQWHWGTFEACGWCEFDDICPADRDEEWERVRFDPSLRKYRTLVEEGSAAAVESADT